MRLPQGLPQAQMENTWATVIDPVLSFPPNQGLILTGIKLIAGINVINHKLGRLLQGYVITDQDAQSSIYKSQPFNKLTLTLTSTGACTIRLWVF